VRKSPALIVAIFSILLISAVSIGVLASRNGQPTVESSPLPESVLPTKKNHDDAEATTPLISASIDQERSMLILKPIVTDMPITGIAIEMTVAPSLTTEPISTGTFELGDLLISQGWTVAVNKQETDLVNEQTSLSFAALNMGTDQLILQKEMELRVPLKSPELDISALDLNVLRSRVELTQKNNEQATIGTVVIEQQSE
jgi:hypothetical protein